MSLTALYLRWLSVYIITGCCRKVKAFETVFLKAEGVDIFSNIYCIIHFKAILQVYISNACNKYLC